jgi:hypothetical protein
MRRWLGLGVAEAEALPWWEFRMLAEELLADKPWVHYTVEVEMPEREEQAGSDLDSLSGLGMTTTAVEAEA